MGPGPAKSKKVLDVFLLEETLPDLLDFLLGKEDSGGVGLRAEQARKTSGATCCFAAAAAYGSRFLSVVVCVGLVGAANITIFSTMVLYKHIL